MAWKQQVQARTAEPTPAPRVYRSPRLFNTQYLDGEQQRAKKAVLHANEAVIVGMIMQGVPVIEIALAFNVTDVAIRNRMKAFGVKPRPAAPVGAGLRRWMARSNAHHGHSGESETVSLQVCEVLDVDV